MSDLSEVHLCTGWTKKRTTLKCITHMKAFYISHRSKNDILNAAVIKMMQKLQKNRLRLAKVIVKNIMSRFYGSLCILVNRHDVTVRRQTFQQPSLASRERREAAALP